MGRLLEGKQHILQSPGEVSQQDCIWFTELGGAKVGDEQLPLALDFHLMPLMGLALSHFGVDSLATLLEAYRAELYCSATTASSAPHIYLGLSAPEPSSHWRVVWALLLACLAAAQKHQLSNRRHTS